MKKFFFIALLSFTLSLLSLPGLAQCSICTRTAAQLGEKNAKSLNAGILYLAAVPFAVVGLISYRWWKNNKDAVDEAQ